MRHLFDLFERFRADERGAFAVIFGLMAIVLFALAGAVVDFVSLQQARNRAQIALDAATLALQPEIFKEGTTKEDIAIKAQALIRDRIGDPRVSAVVEPEDVIIDPENGSLLIESRLVVPTIFVQLVGVDSLPANILAEATRKKLALEVVMVLDNSGSMQQENRMTNLKEAAECATNILMYEAVDADCERATGAEVVENVKMGIVPFTMFVNVGSSNSNAAWIDRTGASSIADDNFDNDDDEETLIKSVPPDYTFPDRFDLFAATGEAWRGCVVARPHTKSGTEATKYLDTDDTPPTGGDTRFVPMFSPDMVYGVGGNSYVADSPAMCDRPAHGATTCVQVQLRTNCNSSMSNGSCTIQSAQTPYPYGPENFLSDLKYEGAFYGRHAPSCTCRNWTSYSSWQHHTGTGNNQTFLHYRTCVGGGYQPTGLSNRELQERVCKYHAGVSGSDFSKGPNADCTRTPILPLTNDPEVVKDTIEDMEALGGTNIHMGTVWGLRVLSPTEPFTQGADYDQATKKVMIIMTDGENTAYNLSTHCGSAQRGLNGACYNTAYGFPYNSKNIDSSSTSGGNVERMGELGILNSNLVAAMNSRLLQTCANAKAAGPPVEGNEQPTGIEIYTIGLATDAVSQSTPEVVRQMLEDCASDPSHAHFPETPENLETTFQQIALQLAKLRLAQ